MVRKLSITFCAAFAVLFAAPFVKLDAQTPDATPKVVNFRYSQNPKTRSSVAPESSTSGESPARVETARNLENSQPARSEAKLSGDAAEPEKPTVGEKNVVIADRASMANMPPTEIYKVGIGDILFISLQGAPSGSTTYFTVLNDGTIDYPLASETVFVKGLTTDEIEEKLVGFVKVFEDPQFVVRVREHSSHTISVLGLVEKSGEKFLQREAVPLFVIRAEAIVRQDADSVVIRRANSAAESYDLNFENDEKVLIFPGDIVEFVRREKPKVTIEVPQFFYIGGNIASVGQKDFYPGMTLTQAILASGGLKKPKVREIIIRRKNSEGLLESESFDLDAVKNGKVPDPILNAGDTIEIID